MTYLHRFIYRMLRNRGEEDDMPDNKSDDGIGEYYARCARQRKAAWDALQKAKAEGASADTIRNLERRLDWASYTGD